MPTNSKSAPKSGVSRSEAIRTYLSEHPGAMPKDVQAALKARGISVATGLVGVIKNGMKTKTKGGTMKAAKKTVGRPKAGGVNKSQAVRDYLAANPGASPGAVQQALKARGIIISASLASQIKYAKPKGSAKKPAAKSAGRPKGGVNKSQAIRDFMAQNPSAGPSAIRKGLKAKGIVVTDSLVGAIKYAKRGKKTAKAAGRSVGRPRAAASNGQLRAEDLLAAKAFVDRVGGAAAARRAIEVLERLV